MGCDAVCPPGFRVLDGGAGCEAVRPSAECPPRTLPQLGSDTCLPVGVQSCAAGFVTDSSGWGCRDVSSAALCLGATREKLGVTGCVPVSDCAAPFPPADATLFVSAAYTAGQLDSTHFDTISAAVLAADAGTVIAIDEGTYPGTVAPPRSVSLIGRCAEKVVLVPPDGGTNVGVRFVSLQGAVARNLTVRGFYGGIIVFGGTVDLSGLVIEGNSIGGLVVSDPGTQVTLRDSVIRGQRARPPDRQVSGAYVQKAGNLLLDDVAISDNEFLGVVATNPDGGVTVRRSVVRDTFPIAQGPVVGTFGVGVYAVDGAWFVVEESAVLHNTGEGLLVARGGTRPASGVVRRSTVRDTRPNVLAENAARGVEVAKEGTLVVEDSTMMGNAEHEILATESGHLWVTNSTTVGSTNPSVPSGTGLAVAFDAGVDAKSLAIVQARSVGVDLQTNGFVRLENSIVTDMVYATALNSNIGPSGLGFSERSGGMVHMVGGVVRRAVGVGILISFAFATLDGAMVLDTQGEAAGSGRAVSVQDTSVFNATRSAFIGSHETGVTTFDPNTHATLNECSIESTQTDRVGNFGIGALATTGSTLELNACTVTSSASIGVAVSDASAVVRASAISWNQTALHAQDGSALKNSEVVSLQPNELEVSTDTRFVGNAVLTGLGTVPLPSK